MLIYENSHRGFVEDVEGLRLQARLEQGFERKVGWVPADRRGWEAAYGDFSRDLEKSGADPDIRVALEYHLTAAGRFRLDVLLAGRNDAGDQALIVEMKGWEDAQATDIPEVVSTTFRGKRVPTLHPSVQAWNYRELLRQFNTDVERLGIGVNACAYLNRLHRRSPEPLESAPYTAALRQAPAFFVEDRAKLRAHIAQLVPMPSRSNVLDAIENGKLKPTQQLVDAVERMLDGNEEFLLVDDQRVAFNTIRAHLLASTSVAGRRAFIVEGGPGTGKSVIALRLIAELFRAGRMAAFVAPNAAFRDTISERMSQQKDEARRRTKSIIRSAYSFHTSSWNDPQAHDVLIVDEAHRLKRQAYQYHGENMVADMVRAARVSVFFVDGTQQVSWNDCGSREEILSQAKQLGVEVTELPPLQAQFRCNGSSGYLNWVDHVLQLRPTANFDGWGNGDYEFQVFDDAKQLYDELRRRNGDNRARLIAGYAWNWPTEGRMRDGAKLHVSVGGLQLPWNYLGENWATSPDGIEQVGCVHTSQGVEFDHVGILIGGDMVARGGRVTGIPEKRAKTDKSLNGWKQEWKAAGKDLAARARVEDRVQRIIKNTYKVLLTRGRKSCLVWCEDEELRRYLRDALARAKTPRGVTANLASLAAETQPPHYGA